MPVPGRRLSVIIPTLDESAGITALLLALQPLRQRGHELVLVDGGSRDATVARATALVDRVLETAPGRGRQLHAGARVAGGDVFWFLHADTVIPAQADRAICDALAAQADGWGRFDIVLDDAHVLLRVVGWCMNLRSRLTGIATGDQGMFVTRRLYEQSGGFADIPLMEDVALSTALRRLQRPHCLRSRLRTSARRWRRHGILRTILLMWSLRLRYFLGASPEALARRYGATGA